MEDVMGMELLWALLLKEQALDMGDAYTLAYEYEIGYRWYRLAIQMDDKVKLLTKLRVN